jgi:hypothetical protein
LKSFLITLFTWAVLFGGIYYGYHRVYYPPADWIGALIVAFFIALGIGALRKSNIDKRDAALVAQPEGPPPDGERVAIAGTLEPIGATLQAPFSGNECIAWDYSVQHRESSRSGSSSTTVQDRLGIALAPCVIRSGVRDIRLLAFPSIANFPQTAVDRNRAAAYLASAPADDQSLGRVFLHLTEAAHLFDDGTGAVRKDWILSLHRDLDGSSLIERIIPVGDKVCVIGTYSAEKNAIVTDASGGGVRLLRGTRNEALQSLRASRSGDFIAAAFLIVVPALIAWGALNHREHYFEVHGQPSVRGERQEGLMNAPNAITAASLLDAGADVNLRAGDGLTPLMRAAADGRPDLVRLFLERGARVNDLSADKRTALAFARLNGHDDIAATLLKAGGR